MTVGMRDLSVLLLLAKFCLVGVVYRDDLKEVVGILNSVDGVKLVKSSKSPRDDNPEVDRHIYIFERAGSAATEAEVERMAAKEKPV